MSEADTTPFEIIPLSGRVGPLSLVGTALPFKGVTFATEQRIKTRFYPGNPVATQTVTGPIKPPTTITGRWMDLSLGDGAARALVRDIEYLCERAIPVEVRWGGRATSTGEDPAIIRRGLIKKFEPKYNRTIDAEWSLEFDWSGDPLQSAPPTFAPSIVDSNELVDFSDMLRTNAEETQSWIDAAWSYIAKGTNAMLVVSEALDGVQNAVADVTILVDGASAMLQEAAELPSSVIDRLRGACDSVVRNCMNARAAYDAVCGLWDGQQLPETLSLPGAAEDFALAAKQAVLGLNPTDDPMARLDVQTAQFALFQNWDSTAERAANIAATYAARQVPEVIAILRPPAGSDLRDLAIKYYDGNPDLWIVIADYNGFDSSVVPATPTGPSEWGAPPVYIPRLTAENMGLVWSEP